MEIRRTPGGVAQPPEVPFADILLDVTAGYEFTVVACDDFGHGGVNTVRPIGAAAHGICSDRHENSLAAAGRSRTRQGE